MNPSPMAFTATACGPRDFRTKKRDLASLLFTGVTGLATFLILAILAVILGNVAINGWSLVTWDFVSSGTEAGLFEVGKTGVFPMIFGTAARVILMTIMVIPVGVVTAIYLSEYALSTGRLTRVIRSAVNNLAGVPSIVFGLFGLGFFISFVGGYMDSWVRSGEARPYWGAEGLLWASATLAVMTLPVVIVATEEALRAIAPGLREASLALGATKFQTVVKIVLPNALSGILTGGILAVSRAAGEVAPILLTGAAYYLASLPGSINEKFMDLAYHVLVLCTQSPEIDRTKPLLYGTVFVLLLLTFTLNFVAILIRARVRRAMRAAR